MNRSGVKEPTIRRRLGFAVKVLGDGGIRSHDTRRWQSGPNLGVSLEAFHDVLAYCKRNDIRMYRISSDFVPYGTHPDMPQFHGQLKRFSEELADAGRAARAANVRLSLHPSQYIILNAADAGVADKSIADFNQQAELLDAMELSEEAVVITHVGGVYGDRESSLRRFITNHARLGEPARRRLVVENDEFSYSIADCLRIHEALGIRVIFDHQHHRLNTGGLATDAAARAALATWSGGSGATRPKIHFSSPRLDGRETGTGAKLRREQPLLRQHADYIDPWTFGEFMRQLGDIAFDVMLEAKAKDLAVLKLRKDLALLGFDDVI